MIQKDNQKEQGETREIGKKILLALVAGVVITTLIAAPGLALAAKPFINQKKYDRRRFRETLKRMTKQRVIEMKENEKGETVVKITKKGEKRVLKYKIDDLTIQRPKKWDGLWRVVIFDIPNKKRLARDVLRDKLKNLGFYKIQKSVFVHPYECEKEIEFIKAIFNIQRHVLLIRAKDIDTEDFLRYHFGLT